MGETPGRGSAESCGEKGSTHSPGVSPILSWTPGLSVPVQVEDRLPGAGWAASLPQEESSHRTFPSRDRSRLHPTVLWECKCPNEGSGHKSQELRCPRSAPLLGCPHTHPPQLRLSGSSTGGGKALCPAFHRACYTVIFLTNVAGKTRS